jgi:HSP20 family protein
VVLTLSDGSEIQLGEKPRSTLQIWRRPPPAREYHRVFQLTEAIDRNGIRASMKNGVLRLLLPKASEALPRRITVRADG